MKTILSILLICLCIGCQKKTSGPGSEPPRASGDILSRGVNLSNWFNDYSDPAQFGNRFSLSKLQLIKTSGFTYVRIPIGATILFNAAQPDQLNSSNLMYVDAAIDNCIKAGLGVTINLHPLSNDTDTQLATDSSFGNKIAAYWKAVAAYFKKYSPDKLFFEVITQ